MPKIKTYAEYEELFEDLMIYSGFTDSSKIKTSDDLYKWFGNIAKDAKVRGSKFNPLNPPMQKFRDEMGKALGRIQQRPFTKKIPTITERVVESRKIFRTFKDARSDRLTAVNPDDIPVYRSRVVINERPIIVFRDEFGRFAKAPVIEE